ncbi:MAG TPA: 5-deoxy-glucuronate isomerase, partial [Pyrinomonadaceae bacterium]|nr:5-deoxy-glucuronate isomerase [Pyrinomonadaceae bacterium]
MNPITSETCFVPKTHEGKGRRTAVEPGRTAARYLHYGRITLAAGDQAVKFNNNNHEVGLICLNGKATVKADGEAFELDRYDAVYVPRDSEIEVEASGSDGCDLAEVSAPVEKRYPL